MTVPEQRKAVIAPGDPISPSPSEKESGQAERPVRRMTMDEWNRPGFPMSLARAAADAIPEQYLDGLNSTHYNPKFKGETAAEEHYPSEAATRARKAGK